MKKGLITFIVALIMTLGLSVNVYAAQMKVIETYSGVSAKDRSVNGTEFSCRSVGGRYSLYAKHNGVTRRLSDSFKGGKILSDGATVFYLGTGSSKVPVYKTSVTKPSAEFMGYINCRYGELVGYYKNNIFFINDRPDGRFCRFNLATKNTTRISSVPWVTTARQVGNKFIINDGSGAGYSYLGVYYANTKKSKKVSGEPVTWYITTKKLIFAEVTEGYYLSGSPYTIRVCSYDYSSGSIKTVLSPFKVKRVQGISSRTIKYMAPNGRVNTKQWGVNGTTKKTEATKYKIRYNLNGGTNNKTNPTAYTKKQEVIFKSPTREGHYFAGWYLNGKRIQRLKKGNSGDKSLVALWIPMRGKTITTKYMDSYANKLVDFTGSYTDYYFIGLPSNYGATGLAKLSAMASGAVYNAKGATSAKTFLGRCGFDKGYRRYKPVINVKTRDKVHASYAYKTVGETTIVAVMIRGTTDTAEWLSNFDKDPIKNAHGGIIEAYNALAKDFDAYIKSIRKKDSNIDLMKFWITGHSRGGAVAHILAAALTKKYGVENVCAYTFAAPNTHRFIANNKKYDNIFNFVNPDDIVPYYPMTHVKHGYVVIFNGKKAEMKNRYKDYTGRSYSSFSIKCPHLLTSYISWMDVIY